MNVPDDSIAEDQVDSLSSSPQTEVRELWWPALGSVLLLTVLTGVVFPCVLTVLAQLFFRSQSDGSLLTRGGRVIGSDLIGQNFTAPGYFHPRPSAAGNGYDATASGGTNLGTTNPKFHEDVRQLAEDFRSQNDLPPDATAPIDAVTRSGSGLDPHISPANAAFQTPRVARVRGLSEEQVRILVAEHTQGRQFGVLGEPRVSVLALNMVLDRLAPLPSAPQGLAPLCPVRCPLARRGPGLTCHAKVTCQALGKLLFVRSLW